MNISDASIVVIMLLGVSLYFGIKNLIERRFGNGGISEMKENAKEAIEKYRSEYDKNDKVRRLLITTEDTEQQILEKGKLVLNGHYNVDNEDDSLVNLWCSELSSVSVRMRSMVMTSELAVLLIEVATYNVVMKMLDIKRRIAAVNSLLAHATNDFDFEEAVEFEMERDDYWHRIQETKADRNRIIDRIRNYLNSQQT